MAAWTTIPDSALVAGQFWSDVKAGAALRNTEASADGATGAPRTKGRALDTYMGRIAANGSTEVGFVDIDRFEVLFMFGSIAYATTSNFQIALSNDNGSSFGGFQTLFGGSFGTIDGPFFFSLRTGDVVAGTLAPVAFVPLSGTNAVRFRHSVNNSGNTIVLTAFCLGGLTA